MRHAARQTVNHLQFFFDELGNVLSMFDASDNIYGPTSVYSCVFVHQRDLGPVILQLICIHDSLVAQYVITRREDVSFG